MFYNAKDFLSKNNITVLFSYSVSDIEKSSFKMAVQENLNLIQIKQN